MVNRARSLEDLEGEVWGAPEYGSQLVLKVHRLRRIPLHLLTIENLRLLLGQRISPGLLLPLAMEQLESDPLVEGALYPGDLLGAVVRLDPAVLRAAGVHPRLRALALAALGRLRGQPDALPDLVRDLESFVSGATA